MSLDWITDLPPSHYYDAILVVVDRLTKQAIFIATKKSMSAPDVASLFLQHVIRAHGLPDSLVSDRDPVFTSHFWHRLQPLRLAIGLGVEGGRAVGTNAQKFQETAPEVRSEHRIPVTDQGILQSVGQDNMMDEEGGHVRRRHGFFRGYENRMFCKSVHHHEDCVVIVTGRKIRYPVQRNTAPGPGRGLRSPYGAWRTTLLR